MKKALIIFVCIMLCFCVISCSRKDDKLEGTYASVQIGTGATFTFDGDIVTITYMSAGVEVYTVEGMYEIYKDSITITLTGEDYEQGNIFSGAHTFEEGDGYIVIGSTRYTKQ